MEINRIYRLNINDYLFIDIIYDGSSIAISSLGNCPINSVHVVNIGNRAIIKVAGIPRASINLETGNIISNLNIVPTAAVRNYSESVNAKGEDEEYYLNQVVYEHHHAKGIPLESELHTHFMEVLSGEEFLNIVLKYLDWVGLDDKYILCSTYPTMQDNPRELDMNNVVTKVQKSTILSKPNIYNSLVSQLTLPVGNQVPFEMLTEILSRRTALLDLIGYNLAQKQIMNLKVPENQLDNEVRALRANAKADVYTEILIASLEILKKQGIKYVELSYSNPNTIVKMYDRLKGKTPEGISFNFLLSENRNAKAKAFREHYKEGSTVKRNKGSVECLLPKLIKAGYVTGFDLMGMEQEILPMDYQKDSIDNNSLYDKLEPILKILNSFDNKDLICRLHAGEIKYQNPFEDGKSNPERTLEIVDLIARNNSLIIPPPQIRLGHALHVNKNQNYLNLLKKYNVTIEINASSNFALSNVKNMFNIPYRWYIDNGIPVVLGTDGGGFYLTTAQNEAVIAEDFAGTKVMGDIQKNDHNEIERRGL